MRLVEKQAFLDGRCLNPRAPVDASTPARVRRARHEERVNSVIETSRDSRSQSLLTVEQKANNLISLVAEQGGLSIPFINKVIQEPDFKLTNVNISTRDLQICLKQLRALFGHDKSERASIAKAIAAKANGFYLRIDSFQGSTPRDINSFPFANRELNPKSINKALTLDRWQAANASELIKVVNNYLCALAKLFSKFVSENLHALNSKSPNAVIQAKYHSVRLMLVEGYDFLSQLLTADQTLMTRSAMIWKGQEDATVVHSTTNLGDYGIPFRYNGLNLNASVYSPYLYSFEKCMEKIKNPDLLKLWINHYDPNDQILTSDQNEHYKGYWQYLKRELKEVRERPDQLAKLIALEAIYNPRLAFNRDALRMALAA